MLAEQGKPSLAFANVIMIDAKNKGLIDVIPIVNNGKGFI